MHLFSTRLDSTLSWFQANLGLAPQLSAPLKVSGVDTNYVPVDNVSISVMQVPAPGQPRPAWWPAEVGDTLANTDGTVIDHIAFSYLDIKPVFERMKRAGVEIVHPIANSAEYGLTSFFVRGSDGLLIEIVEEAPVPEGVWLRK